MSTSSEIVLEDNTQPLTNPLREQGLRPAPTHLSFAKKLSRNSVRDSLARRKYAKWQRDRYGNMVTDNGRGRESSSISRPSSLKAPTISRESSVGPSQRVRSELLTDGAQDLRESTTGAEEGGADEAEELPQQSEIDILYENQRGWFFFGMPMYSEKSLLNLDPSAWMMANLEESPVNIHNAQVPDPSWEWAWRTWYVDMSHDVDEEGWQYSFSFASRFPWHGTHPWCHSFVRRRRWLRKRVRKRSAKARKDAGLSLTDYFTVGGGSSIKSRESSILTEGPTRSNYIGRYSRISQEDWEQGIAPDDINNVVALMKAVRVATLDREKIDAVKQFVRRGGEELYYLDEKIPDIMSLLLFQTSRRQLVEYLQRSIDEIPESSSDAQKRKRANLLKALECGRRDVQGLRFWGNVQPDVLPDDDENSGGIP